MHENLKKDLDYISIVRNKRNQRKFEIKPVKIKTFYPNHCNNYHSRCNKINQYCTNFIQIAPEYIHYLTIVIDLASVVTNDLKIKFCL
jgi:hypothetical protein